MILIILNPDMYSPVSTRKHLSHQRRYSNGGTTPNAKPNSLQNMGFTGSKRFILHWAARFSVFKIRTRQACRKSTPISQPTHQIHHLYLFHTVWKRYPAKHLIEETVTLRTAAVVPCTRRRISQTGFNPSIYFSKSLSHTHVYLIEKYMRLYYQLDDLITHSVSFW